MKKFETKRVLLGVLAVGLIFLPAELRNHSKHPAGIEQNKANLTLHNKLSGLDRKAASAEWFMHQRNYPLGYIPENAEIRALEEMRTRMIPELAAKGIRLAKSAAGQLNWEHHGPGNIGGRLRGLIVHPNNPNNLYVGSVSGGVWKSMNGGATWAPAMNDLITLNISALAMKPGDPNMLYAGTGEAFFTGDCMPGRGLLKTTDGGNTWKRVHVAQGLNSPFITAIAVSPANSNVVYAAGRQAMPQFSAPAESVPDPGVSAIFKSTDGGETWQDVTTGKGIDHNPQIVADDFATDVVASSADANVVYAAFGIFAAGGIWKSTNGGQTWSRLTAGLPDPGMPNQAYSRIKLAMAPSNPNVLYASFAYLKKEGDTVDLKDEALLGVWKTTNSGENWTAVTTPLTINQRNRDSGNTTALGSQGTYANAIIVHPGNPDIVFLAGLDIYKSMDGGKTWSQVSMWIPPGSPANPEKLPFVHADHHVFAFDLSTNPPTLYNGSDGGIARSRDLGTTWDLLNHDLGVTQFYSFAVHPLNTNIMIGGTQDNGTPMTDLGRINEWQDITGGDGGPAYFDFNDPNIVYASVYHVNMYRYVADWPNRRFVEEKSIGFTDGSNGITQADVEGAEFFAPFELSPNNPNVLVLGTNRLLKSTNRGDSWTSLTNAINVPIVTVAIADGNDQIIWLGTDDAKIYKTEDDGGSFANVTGANLPNRFITDIEFDPSNNRTVYLTYSGYGTPHVFKSTNAGANWTDVTNNLPDAPANTMQVHPQQANVLFLGTDIGVFISENGGQTWQPAASNFPTVPVVAIQLHLKTNRIYAATHGRGAYSAELGGAAALNVDVAEVSLQMRPGQTRSTTFNLSNIGAAPLSFNITATGPGVNAGLIDSASHVTSISGLSSGDFPKLPRLDLNAAKNIRSAVPLQRANATARKSVSPPLHKPSSDVVLMLDDGDNEADDFVGFGPGSANGFTWMNVFPLQNFGFKLKSFDFYMRSEYALSNEVYLAILDANGQKIMEANLDVGTSILGDWNTIVLNNPVTFSAGSGFQILVRASNEIDFPAGTDTDAQVPALSFYFDPEQNQFVNLNTVQGFAQGAFLIRAKGEKISGGGNQPPVAKGTISKLNVLVNEPITFDASASFDPDGQITQYLWNFGDGGTSAQKIATHAYAQAGMYTVTLTVTDNQGATGQATGQITVTSATVSRLTVNPMSGNIAAGGSQNITVTFDAQGLAEGNYQGQLIITSNGGNRTLPVGIFVSNTVGVDDDASELPGTFTLAQNYPNPFSANEAFGNPETAIKYQLPEQAQVELAVYDLSGRRVATLESGMKTTGVHEARWNGRDQAGRAVASGVYFYRLQATARLGQSWVMTKKMTVMR